MTFNDLEGHSPIAKPLQMIFFVQRMHSSRQGCKFWYSASQSPPAIPDPLVLLAPYCV